MNCVPGDLARVISPGRKIRCPLCHVEGVAVKPDTIVRVTTYDGQAWILEEPIRRDVELSCGALIVVICRAIADEALRPIRDPGADAVDQMVKLVGPAPMTLTEVREVSHG